jgi:four helix bundle protein
MRLARFEQMEIWKLARALNRDIYSVSGKSAFARDFGMGNQIRRASVSVASNIAEGFESQSNASFIRYLICARGSAAEVRAQLYLAVDMGYLSEAECAALLDRAETISRQITGFIKYLKSTKRKD